MVEESIARHPELIKEVENVLESKDESKKKRFLSKLKSATKHLGHEIAEKFKSGWKVTK